MAWTLLKNISDWEKHQQKVTLETGLGTGAAVNWGHGPQVYPCLVCTSTLLVPANTPSFSMSYVSPRLLSAYVYPDDAAMLLHETVVEPLHCSTPDKGISADSTEQQSNYNDMVTAYLLALVRELREIGALKADRFEQSLMESLALVDAITAEKRDEILTKLHHQEHTLLNRLYPPVSPT